MEPMSFAEFMNQVEYEIALLAGMSSAELLPYSYHTAWESERNPVEVAHSALEQNRLI